MTKRLDFEVFVSDYSSSVDEWRRALSAPESELPELSPEQKDFARRFGVSEEEYRRGVLAGIYGNKRMKNRGRDLGNYVQEILGGLGPDYSLKAVLWEGSRLRWLLRIQTPERIVGVPVAFELADDVLDSRVLSEIQRLKETVLAGVGRADLIAKS